MLSIIALCSLLFIVCLTCFILVKARQQGIHMKKSAEEDAKAGKPDPKKIAVVGAGPSGLVTARELAADGHDVTIFEMTDRVGGVFAHYYGTGRLTSSTATTTFSSFPPAVDTPTVWGFREYSAYLDEFAKKFELNIEFGAKVENILRRGKNDMEVTVSFATGENERRCEKRSFHYVAICMGIAQVRKEPLFVGSGKFGGEIIHSQEYLTAEPFTGKKVCVVGLGESGSDITLEIAKVAEKVCVSARRGPGYVVPRYFGGMPSDVDTNRVYHSIPKDLTGSWIINAKRWAEQFMMRHDDDVAVLKKAGEINRATTNTRGLAALQRFGTKSISFVHALVYHDAAYKPKVDYLTKDHVVFVDGSKFEADVILCCTGYCVDFDLLDASHTCVRQRSSNVRRLYKHTFDLEFGEDIAWIGYCRPHFGSIPAISELAARYWAELIAGRKKLPCEMEMQRVIDEDERRDFNFFPMDGQHINTLVDFCTQMNDFAVLIGSYPPMFYLFVHHFDLWFQIMFAPLNTMHYRVTGHEKFDMDVLRYELGRLPTMPFYILFLEWVTFVFAVVTRRLSSFLFA